MKNRDNYEKYEKEMIMKTMTTMKCCDNYDKDWDNYGVYRRPDDDRAETDRLNTHKG